MNFFMLGEKRLNNEKMLCKRGLGNVKTSGFIENNHFNDAVFLEPLFH